MNYSKFFLFVFIMHLSFYDLDCMQGSFSASFSSTKALGSDDINRYIKETKVQVLFTMLICTNFYPDYNESFFLGLLNQLEGGFHEIALLSIGGEENPILYFKKIMYNNLLLIMEALSVCEYSKDLEQNELFEFKLMQNLNPTNSLDVIINYNKKNLELLLSLLSQEKKLVLPNISSGFELTDSKINPENFFDFIMSDIKRLGFEYLYRYNCDHGV